MEELINYINSGNCFALIGAGPSCEVGLPNWKQLAEGIINDLKEDNLEITSFMHEYIDKNDYAKFFNEVWNTHGQYWLLNKIKLRTVDNNLNGKIYNLISNFPFRSYFTTNYDDVLSRHLNNSNKIHKVLSNTKNDLERFDPDTLIYIIKLHGTLDKPETLILTEDQYFNYQYKAENKYYIDFLKGYFLAHKFFIVGYSMNDPYLTDLLKSLTANFRRQIPIFAIISDVSNSQIKELSKRCNIKVFSYANKSGKHSELSNILDTIARFIRTDQDGVIKRDENDLKLAQSLYMWHKFQTNKDNDTIDINSLKSILLSIINNNYRSTFTRTDILGSLNSFLGTKPNIFADILDRVLNELVLDGFIEKVENESYKGKAKLLQYVERFNNQYDDLVKSYQMEISNSLQKNFHDVDNTHVDQFKKAAIDVIIDLFSERAVEIMQMIFEKKPIVIQQASNLFRLINLRAKDITNSQIRFFFIRCISDMLTTPTKIQENILEYYSKAYFSIQALQIDPIGDNFRKQFLNNRTVLVDSTVIIPLLAHSCLDYEFFNVVVNACNDNQIKLITTTNLIDEVFFHAEWAKKLINDNGDQSIAVLSAAIGNYPYRRNAFLDGYIRYCTTNENINFEEYLKLIFNQNFNHKDTIVEYLMKKYSIQQVEIDSFGKHSDLLKYEKEIVFDFIKHKAGETNKVDKSLLRMKSEAEVYVMIRNWKLRDGVKDGECSFLSQGGFINKIARESELSLDRNIVIRPDALYEFLVRMSSKIEKQMSFKEVLISTYFRATEYFIDKTKYQDFFSTLINRAEQAYKKGLSDFNKYINNNLHTSSIEEYFALDKPLFVYSLEEGLKEQLIAKEKEVSDLKEVIDVKNFELEKTKTQLDNFQQKDLKRKKYAAKQRRAQAKKKRKK